MRISHFKKTPMPDLVDAVYRIAICSSERLRNDCKC